MWDNLLIQTELTINLLRQATLNPRMSAWEYYNVPFDYSASPLEVGNRYFSGLASYVFRGDCDLWI